MSLNIPNVAVCYHGLARTYKECLPNHFETFYKKYNITDDKQIPNISRFSPVSLVIGLRPGELCEITRPSRTSITSLFYRLCSN